MTTWNPLTKKNYLVCKPLLSQELATHVEDRELELTFNQLQEFEEHAKKLYKEVKRFEECLLLMHKTEQKLSSELCNSPSILEHAGLRGLVEDYQSVVYQMGHNTDDLIQLSQKTVVEPMKKITAEFAAINAALRKRDQALSDCLKAQSKYEKMSKMEKTGTNVVKTEQAKKAFEDAKAEFTSQNKLLLHELPQFYEKRVSYFQPCLQALIRTQVDYYGETTRLFTHLVSSNPTTSNLVPDEEYQKEVDGLLGEIGSLSIVGT